MAQRCDLPKNALVRCTVPSFQLFKIYFIAVLVLHHTTTMIYIKNGGGYLHTYMIQTEQCVMRC